MTPEQSEKGAGRGTDTPRRPPSRAELGSSDGRKIFGIKAKLILAFCAMAGLTMLAAGTAWYGFIVVARSVAGITSESIPTMTVSFRLAERSEEIAATAPALMTSKTQAERILEQTELEGRAQELVELTEALKAMGIPHAMAAALEETRDHITAELRKLNAAVEERLHLSAQRETKSAEMSATHASFVEALEPLVDDAVFNLIISGEDLTGQSAEAITRLVEGGVNTINLLLTINSEANLAAGLIAQATSVSDPVLIQPIRERFEAASSAVEQSLRQVPDTAEKQSLLVAAESLLRIGSGDDNIFDVRGSELQELEASADLAGGSNSSELLATKRQILAGAAQDAHGDLLEILTPLVDEATFNLVITSEDVTAQSTEAITNLIDGGVTVLQVLLSLRAEGNLAAGLLSEAAGLSDPTMIQPVRERFIAAKAQIAEQLDQLPEGKAWRALQESAERLTSYGIGDDSIFALRERELRQLITAERLLQRARLSSTALRNEVNELVFLAQGNSDQAALQANETMVEGEVIMLLIAGLSILGATLIVFLFVTPRVVQPLESITRAMSELAAGDTAVEIPARERKDEIGRMAQSLGVFRDTAIELQKSNLREIREARRRLTDAIESISEGFSLYDGDDRLVVCNDIYRKILYPELADEIAPGMTFEAIARLAAERGFVKDAQGRVEEWLAERMARHRETSGSHLQRRDDGRWILVSERKTEDGGTVAVYSDITELKQREQELSEKSNSLEQLSSQLAKYLSPQVYESIFSGRQEVKLASRRKKLTVFFSDIAGFTETADRLESEELTQLLNHYLTEMSRIALDHGATIDKYVGDAIVIFFGDPESQGVKEDALACVKMAIAMRDRMRDLQAIWRDAGIEKPLKCRIGINTGFCTVGNFGSEDRMDYTIIGGGVNLASRLESAATPGEILISYETYALVKDEIDCEERGEITVKGIAYPVATYEVVDSYVRLAKSSRRIHEDGPTLKLSLDPDAMSADERRRAAEVLRRALDQITDVR